MDEKMQKRTERIIIIVLIIVLVLVVLIFARASRQGGLREVLGNRFQKDNTVTNTTTAAPSGQSPKLATGNYTYSMTSSGISRSYKLHVPRKVATDPLPLVLALHGGGNDGDSQENLTHMNLTSDKGTFLVAYPDGVNKNWNDGRADIAEKTGNADDVTFLTSLISEINTKTPVDTKKVYVTGISNGGMMAYRLACEKPEVFAAIAPVASGLTTELQPVCTPNKSISMIMIQGTADPLVQFTGGDIRLLSGRETSSLTARGATLSATDNLNFWKTKNGCTSEPTRSTLPDTNTTDGTTTDKEVYSCNGSEIDFLKVNNGGHTWPGGIQYLAERFVGKTSRDFDASQVIWDFFKTFSR